MQDYQDLHFRNGRFSNERSVKGTVRQILKRIYFRELVGRGQKRYQCCVINVYQEKGTDTPRYRNDCYRPIARPSRIRSCKQMSQWNLWIVLLMTSYLDLREHQEEIWPTCQTGWIGLNFGPPKQRLNGKSNRRVTPEPATIRSSQSRPFAKYEDLFSKIIKFIFFFKRYFVKIYQVI